mmetsp:Transcript_29146/g.72649  ORF Transcript_29146/g.72649 Transcript_29146/m.72649 type:complete len:97 (-) Transcript_29146:5-295(-)
MGFMDDVSTRQGKQTKQEGAGVNVGRVGNDNDINTHMHAAQHGTTQRGPADQIINHLFLSLGEGGDDKATNWKQNTQSRTREYICAGGSDGPPPEE